MKPIIGVVSRPTETINNIDCHMIDENIKNSIINSGGIPLMITPTQNIIYNKTNPKDVESLTTEEIIDLNRVLDLCNGIIIPGGTRVYEYDSYICEYAKEKNIPVLGICAGMQLMSRIGTDESNQLIDEENSHNKESEYVHKVNIVKDTLLYKIIGKEVIEVNSYHKYKVCSAGLNKVSATCDNVIEAIENNEYAFYLGVQWHPEKLSDENSKKIFDYFINEAIKNYTIKV